MILSELIVLKLFTYIIKVKEIKIGWQLNSNYLMPWNIILFLKISASLCNLLKIGD